jgi:hypothetical protein
VRRGKSLGRARAFEHADEEFGMAEFVTWRAAPEAITDPFLWYSGYYQGKKALAMR